MATVESYTKAYMQPILDATVVDAHLEVDGDLILEHQDGSETTAGNISIPLSTIYPVGCIYLSVNNVNPSTLFGGTWVAFATGRTIIGVDTGQTEFDTVQETGGAKTHTLTTAEMPSHNHTQDAHGHTQNSHNHTQDSHNHTQNSHYHDVGLTSANDGVMDVLAGQEPSGGVWGSWIFTLASSGNALRRWVATAVTAVNQATTATNQATTATNNNTTATNQTTGGGGAHNNLPPYITCYMWKRTA